MEIETHSRRAAATALILGELDELLARVESLPADLEAARASLADSITALEAAGDRYRMAITAFSDEARNEVTEYLQRKTFQETSRGLEEYRTAMEASARAVMGYESATAARQISAAVERASMLFRRSARARTIDAAAIAVASSLTTCLLWYFLGRLH